jgi:hypothetical protein
MANTLRIKRRLTGQAGAPITANAGELAYNKVDNKLYIGDGSENIVIGGAGYFSTNAQLSSETSRATAAEGVVAANLATEISDRAAAVSAEASARVSGDNALDAKITTEKGRIDAILSASQADKDSFAEIVTLINSVDTENDQAFAGYVTSNNAALAAEVTNRTNADSTLQSNINTEASTRASAITTVTGLVTSEASTRAAADSTLQSNINAEASTRSSADSALSSRVTSLETTAAALGTMSTQNANNVAITGGSIDGISFDGGSF